MIIYLKPSGHSTSLSSKYRLLHQVLALISDHSLLQAGLEAENRYQVRSDVQVRDSIVIQQGQRNFQKT